MNIFFQDALKSPLHCLSPKLRKEIVSDQKMSSTLNCLSFPPRPSSNTKMAAAAAVQIREKTSFQRNEKLSILSNVKQIWFGYHKKDFKADENKG